MPVESEKIIYRFPNRARNWQRAASYSQVNSCVCGEICATHYEYKSENPAAAGKKIVFFSDLHFRNTSDQRRRIGAVRDAILEFGPDILISGGDMVSYATDLEHLPEGLRFFSDTAPVCLAVLGNWESSKIWLPHRYWQQIYRDAGFLLLQNGFYDDGVCCFYGADDLPLGKIAPPVWPAELRARLLFAHSPDTIICFDSSGVSKLPPLSICGHTHGGQVRLPFLGAVYSSSIYGRRFDYGLFVRQNSGQKLIISSGLENCSFPFRFNCRREIVCLTLT